MSRFVSRQDVLFALGFNPYDSGNPSNYIDPVYYNAHLPLLAAPLAAPAFTGQALFNGGLKSLDLLDVPAGRLNLSSTTPRMLLGLPGSTSTPRIDFLGMSAVGRSYDASMTVTSGSPTIDGGGIINFTCSALTINGASIPIAGTGTPGTILPLMNATTALVGASGSFARQDHVHPTDTTRAPTVSPTLTGSPTLDGLITLGSNTQAALTVTLNGTTASNRRLRYQTAGVTRWAVGLSAGTEGGSNAGSDFLFNRYDDSGTFLSVPMLLSRATGGATFFAQQTLQLGNAAPSGLPSGAVLALNNANGQNTVVTLDAHAGAPTVQLRRANGSASAPSTIGSGSIMGEVGVAGYGATAWSNGARARLQFFSSEAWTDTAQGAYVQLHTTAAGSITATERLRVTDTGSLIVGASISTSTDNFSKFQVQGGSTRLIGSSGTINLPSQPTGTVLQLGNSTGNDTLTVLEVAGGSTPGIVGRSSSGTSAAPTATTADQALLSLQGRGFSPAGFSSAQRGEVRISSGGTWGNTDTPTYVSVLTTPVGSGVVAERLRVTPSGRTIIQPAGGTFTDDGVNALQVNGLVKVSDSANSITTLQIANTGGNGANLKLSGNTGSGAPSKTIRVVNGMLQVINDSYLNAIMSLSDVGLLTPNDLVLATDTGQTTFSGAWSTWTPTITTGSGTGMTTAVVARYKKFGRLVFFQLNVAITGVGTGAGEILVTLPFTSQDYNGWGGREGVTGKGLTCHVVPSSSLLHISFYDVSSAIASGARMMIAGSYEATT